MLRVKPSDQTARKLRRGRRKVGEGVLGWVESLNDRKNEIAHNLPTNVRHSSEAFKLIYDV